MRTRRWIVLPLLVALVAAVVVGASLALSGPGDDRVSRSARRSASSAPAGTVPDPTPGRSIPAPGLKVAFIGDQGLGPSARRVLELIKAQNADAVVHLGDLDYEDDPAAWEAQVDAVLGEEFPYFIAVGNHDVDEWGAYQDRFRKRLERFGGAQCDGDLGVNSVCRFRGLAVFLSGVGTLGRDHAAYLQDQLARSDAMWKVCAWHKNQAAMQVGGKGNEAGWDAYEECRKGGAIIATAHEHSYERTRTLVSMSAQRVDPSCPDDARVCVDPGRTFAFVSGLGGESIREQERCLPATRPYGCDGAWATIFAEQQDAEYGALFVTFNVNGEPRSARGEFRTVSGRVVDTFDIVTGG